jgi:hypothetical protein
LKAVLHDGVAIHTVKHLGRHFPAELRTALDLGPVPAFTGAQCADCGSRFGLEYDHVNPVANKGETSYENVETRCWEDHKAKTEGPAGRSLGAQPAISAIRAGPLGPLRGRTDRDADSHRALRERSELGLQNGTSGAGRGGTAPTVARTGERTRRELARLHGGPSR